MTSKDAIKNIKETMIIGRHGNIDVGNKYNKEIINIEKDLEILEILKKHIYSSDSSISIIIDDLRCCDDFYKLKEWLKDE